LRDHSHYSTDDSDVCSHCGQPLHAPVPSYGRRGLSPTGLTVAVVLHLLLIGLFLLQPDQVEKRARPAREGEVVYVAPLKGKPKAVQQEQAPRKKAVKTPKVRTAPERVRVQRLPDTITPPDEKPVEVARVEPKAKPEPAPEMDMSAAIEARRRARGAASPSESTEESEEARGNRIAMANIASVNGRGQDDSNQSGGVFSVSNKTFHSMDLKFRGWNPAFKRRWLSAVTVEQGGEPDVETAVVKKMIELIRREKTGDFEWDSHRLGRVVTMSARVRDTAQLQAFLFKEMFPEYKGK
jgi:outer membrane biosynthesis protein TonB